jgi:hypothetical protein
VFSPAVIGRWSLGSGQADLLVEGLVVPEEELLVHEAVLDPDGGHVDAYFLKFGGMKPPLPSGIGRLKVPSMTPVTAVISFLEIRIG